eukprot:COSAG01_NODE_68333_length_264_cov_0.921212_1_plen_33_part_01
MIGQSVSQLLHARMVWAGRPRPIGIEIMLPLLR